MGLNDTPSSNRIHIGFFGRRNAGKSSLVNAVTGQELSVVSDVKGTTTDPVSKAMELLPLGPVVIIDTAGYDDEGDLGTLRVKKTKLVLDKTDIAVLVVDAKEQIDETDEELISLFKEKKIPYIIAYNKIDTVSFDKKLDNNEICVSATNMTNIFELKEKIANFVKCGNDKKPLVGDMLNAEDLVILVTPIDESAPKGRIILPQQQTIRDILDSNAIALVVKETELKSVLASLNRRPKMVITDSQVFNMVSKIVPKDIPLTSFSILFARYKGFLETAVKGVKALDNLKDGDKILISEGCTHHRQCNDIGSVKLPRWIKEYTNADVSIELSSGRDFPDDLSPYSMIIHCGGCMLNEREVLSRMQRAVTQNVAITNYGTTIAHINGILERSLSIFPDLQKFIRQG